MSHRASPPSRPTPFVRAADLVRAADTRHEACRVEGLGLDDRGNWAVDHNAGKVGSTRWDWSTEECVLPSYESDLVGSSSGDGGLMTS